MNGLMSRSIVSKRSKTFLTTCGALETSGPVPLYGGGIPANRHLPPSGPKISSKALNPYTILPEYTIPPSMNTPAGSIICLATAASNSSNSTRNSVGRSILMSALHCGHCIFCRGNPSLRLLDSVSEIHWRRQSSCAVRLQGHGERQSLVVESEPSSVRQIQQ